MIDLLLVTLYLYLPAYIANGAPVIAMKLGFPGGPISEQLFGSHKTYRGFYSGFIGALLVVTLQYELQLHGIFEQYRVLDYAYDDIFMLALLFGIGAIGGDTFKSFFKRRLGKAPGSVWFPFDHIDFIIGATALVAVYQPFPLPIFICALVITPLINAASNALSYRAGLKPVWW